MRLFLDQMIREDVAEALRKLGHDVQRPAYLGLSRADDGELLRHATGEGRVLITLDEDFGDWAVLPLASHCGVVRLKAHPTTSTNILSVLVPFLQRHGEERIADHLVIVSPKRERWIRTG